MKSKKVIFVTALVVIVLAILAFVFYINSKNSDQTRFDLAPRNDTVPQVPVLYDFGDKVVYTTDTTKDKDVYFKDCSARGGAFNVCGNVCKAGAGDCSSMCALTCTIK